MLAGGYVGGCMFVCVYVSWWVWLGGRWRGCFVKWGGLLDIG